MTDLLDLLQAFYREKLAMLLRHQAGARRVSQYDANNTYQYIINREDVQLTWLAKAIVEQGGSPDDSGVEPDRQPAGKAAAAAAAIVEEDMRASQAFVDAWRPRVEAMPNARHRRMLNVILGETLEQQRFFSQALAGRTDLLGQRGEAAGARVGEVMSTRWVG